MTASTAIALASIGVAGLTVLVTYLNVRRQADAAIALEHTKWLREKQDDLYGELIELFVVQEWAPPFDRDDPRLAKLNSIKQRTLRYASDAVLADAEKLWDEIRPPKPPAFEKLIRASVIYGLTVHVREELVGKDEAEKTLARRRARNARAQGDPR